MYIFDFKHVDFFIDFTLLIYRLYYITYINYKRTPLKREPSVPVLLIYNLEFKFR